MSQVTRPVISCSYPGQVSDRFWAADVGLVGKIGVLDAKFSSLHPTHSINILGFKLFEDRHFDHHFTMVDIRSGALFIDEGLLHLWYIELGKEPSENLKHWAGLFKGEPMREDAPDYIRQAYELVDYANLTEGEREMITNLELREQDRIGQLAYARNEGVEEGIEKGRKEALIQTAYNLLTQGISPDVVQKATGLPLIDIQDIQAVSHN